MPKGDIEIAFLGERALQRKLLRISREAGVKIVEPALEKVAQQFAADSTAAIPVDTGKLKSLGMKVRKLRGKRGRQSIGRVVQTPTRAKLGIEPGSKWFYPAHLELGHGNVKGVSFIRAVMKERGPRYGRFLRKAIGRGLERLAKR